MRYSTLMRYALAALFFVGLTLATSCKSRQYVGPVNGKILKSDDLIKDSKSDTTAIKQLNSLN